VPPRRTPNLFAWHEHENADLQILAGFAYLARQKPWTHGGILLRIYKKDSGVATVTYAQALDQALCFGWIDGQKLPGDGAIVAAEIHPAASWQRMVEAQYRPCAATDRLRRDDRCRAAGNPMLPRQMAAGGRLRCLRQRRRSR
jgi:hypothetical protein